MTEQKNFGLDLYRVSAIVTLLLANVLNSFQIANPAIAQFAPILGFLSLEAFFVLSGFLLARSFHGVFMAETFSARDALRFVKHRLLRILPLYWLVLLVNVGIAYAVGYPVESWWRFAFLWQNFFQPIPSFFPESWGLPVVVFAMLMFVGLLTSLVRVIRQQHKPAVFLLTTLGLIAVFLWTKWLYHTQHQTSDIATWDATLKTVAVYRFDSVFIGVLFGLLYLQGRKIWDMGQWIFTFLGFNGLVFLALGIGVFQLDIESHAAFWHILYLPLTTIVLGCFLPLFVAWQTAPSVFGRIVSWLARASYGIYLVHFSIVLLLVEHWLVVDFSNTGQLGLLNAVYVLVSVVLGWLLYTIEKRLSGRVRS